MNELKVGIVCLAVWFYGALTFVIDAANVDKWFGVIGLIWAVWTLGLLVVGSWKLIDKLDKHLGGGDRQ